MKRNENIIQNNLHEIMKKEIGRRMARTGVRLPMRNFDEILANYLQVSKHTIMAWRQNANQIPIDKAIEICKYFDIGLYDLYNTGLKNELKITG